MELAPTVLTLFCTTRLTSCNFIKTAGKCKFQSRWRVLEAQQYGIAFLKGSDDLRTKNNGALKTLKENGTPQRNLQNGSVPSLNNKT